MSKRNAWNFVAHTFAALVLVTLVLCHRWFLLSDVIVWATLREQAQHRYIFTRWDEIHPGEMAYLVEKRTFWDWSWLKWHHVGEIAQWALGAALALGGYEIFFA